MRLEPTCPRVGLLTAFAVAVVLLITAQPSTRALGSSGGLQGDVPLAGPGLVVWGGGTAAELGQAAEQRGCHATTLWAAYGGRFVVYVYGAPGIANEAFASHFPDTMMPPATALVLVCNASQTPTMASIVSVSPLDLQFAAKAFAAINAARSANGRPPLAVDARLQAAAEKYARLALARGELGHTFDGQPWDRAQLEGYPTQLVGEVIASRGTSEPLDVERDTAQLLISWMDSPPHRDIILGKDYAFTDLGVGCATGNDRNGLNAVVCVGMLGIP